MSIIASEIDPTSAAKDSNARNLQEQSKTLKTLIEVISLGGSESARKKHQNNKKLLVRDRIALVLDSGSPFLELSILAGHDIYDSPVPAAGLICGIGLIQGQATMIIANDATVKGGCYYPLTVKKHLRAQAIALENHLPCLYLVDSGGAFLPLQDELFPDHDHFGRIFYNQAKLSQTGIPQVSIVLGPCTAGGAYIPAMSDECIIVKKQGHIFLGGPPLVKAATGEDIDAESLGGAEVHTKISGVADHLAEDEPHAFQLARDTFASFTKPSPPATVTFQAPTLPADTLYKAIPSSTHPLGDIHTILSHIVDTTSLHEFKKDYGTTLICGFATIHGQKIGILANNGVLYSDSALKGTHFIQLCCKRQIPLLFLQNISGFMIGRDYEHEGIAKHGAKLVHAVANANVAKFTIIIGGSYGAGNYAMCGRAFNPTFLWCWPNAKTAVMRGDYAEQVLNQIKPGQAKSLYEDYESKSHAIYASARLWDDGVIDPADTRQILALALKFTQNRPAQHTEFGVFRM